MKFAQGSRITIGVKSRKFTVIQIMGVVLLSVLLVLYDFSSTVYACLIAIGLLVALRASVKALFVRPKIMVEADESGVYLNFSKKKSVYIPYKDIERVFAKNEVGHPGPIYKFGELHVKTKERSYKIGVIKNVSEAERYICEKIAYKPFG